MAELYMQAKADDVEVLEKADSVAMTTEGWISKATQSLPYNSGSCDHG